MQAEAQTATPQLRRSAAQLPSAVCLTLFAASFWTVAGSGKPVVRFATSSTHWTDRHDSWMR
ncbi:unnamed protein product [Polarella glacialis]|uniref:Uncharacterized protein n=1 Tax=Polarella glacialis TaxID=89957 RepID=A0A813LWR2_POLGL|nr:unnamed protein product [Polarella glacialis]